MYGRLSSCLPERLVRLVDSDRELRTMPLHISDLIASDTFA
jgi:hypothetical protein